MRRMKRSLGYAVVGMTHAFEREKNLRMFLYGLIVVIALGFVVRLLAWEWLTIIIAGGIFVIAELLNTAIERFVDVVDHQRRSEGSSGFHANLKAAKDVAAAASLAALIVNIVVICIVFWPYADMTVRSLIR